MENTLDEISHGKVQWLPYLEGFFKGDEGLENQVQQREGDIDPGASRTIDLEGLSSVVRIGRFGAYLEAKRVSDDGEEAVSYTHLRAHETDSYLVCRLLLEKKK